MTVEGPTKRRILDETMRNGLRTQPAPLVRGSSRRIMSMRFQPANISLINRRASHWAVIGSAVQNLGSKLTSGIMFPPRRPSTVHGSARTVLALKGSLRRANTGAPLTAVRRSGQMVIATGGSGGNVSAVMVSADAETPIATVPPSQHRTVHSGFSSKPRLKPAV